MALIKSLNKTTKDRQVVHGEVDCLYSTFTDRGETYLRLETFGSAERKMPGKVSQAIQLDRESAAELVRIIRTTFPSVG